MGPLLVHPGAAGADVQPRQRFDRRPLTPVGGCAGRPLTIHLECAGRLLAIHLECAGRLLTIHLECAGGQIAT